MANLYLKLIEDARKLPEAYRAMGTPAGTYEGSGASITGWKICQITYRMNEDGLTNWFSNDTNMFVDESGHLWEVNFYEEYEEGKGRRSSVELQPVDGEKLRNLDLNGGFFTKVKKAAEAMI